MGTRAKRGKVRVVLRRRNGRFVKQSQPMSRYAAKQTRLAWDARHDSGYYTEIKDA